MKGGESIGYEDVINPDGTILYIGQGSKGNQDSGYYVNSLLYKKERSGLFFSTTEPTSKQVKASGNRRMRYKFEGIYEVVECNVFIPVIGPRINDQLLSFLLIPAKNIFNIPSTQLTKEEEVEVKETSLKDGENMSGEGLQFLELQEKRMKKMKFLRLIPNDSLIRAF